MTTITCPNCGHQFEQNQKVIELRKKHHFWMDTSDLMQAIEQLWRDTGAAHAEGLKARITTEEIAAAIGLSEQHTRRGLTILEAAGAIKRVGKRLGWKLERYERYAS